MIEPTVGRIVHFYDKAGGPCAAIIAYVWHSREVNLMVINPNGYPVPHMHVRLLQDDEKPCGELSWCQWMDYQKGQAAKTELAVERLDEMIEQLEERLKHLQSLGDGAFG